MKKLLIDYLLYGLFFGFITLFTWRRRSFATPLLYVGIFIFWFSFIIQVVGMIVLYYLPPYYSWEMELYVLTIGGMITSVIMMIHSYLFHNKSKENRE